MHARMFQRRHQRSPNAIAKDYSFIHLPMTVDPEPLREEIARVALPWIESLWKWHRGTQFCILRAGAAGSLPGDELLHGAGRDAPVLAELPRVRTVLDELFGFAVPMAWIGRSPTGSCIRMHVDNTPHWDEHHRLHIPLETSPGARLGVVRRFVHMPPGTVWAFNNSRPHGALNDGPERLHLVFDLPATPATTALLARGERVEGELDAAALARLSEDPLAGVFEAERDRPAVLARMLQQ